MNLWELSVDAVTAIVHLLQIHHLETWWLNLCMYCWIRWCEQLIYCKIQLIVNRAPHHPRNANDPRNSWDRRAGWLSYSRNNAKKNMSSIPQNFALNLFHIVDSVHVKETIWEWLWGTLERTCWKPLHQLFYFIFPSTLNVSRSRSKYISKLVVSR